jgi:hypothetical protein
MKIVCGGQTGVDRGALEAAVVLGLDYGGWCPAGGWAKDRPTPPGVRADFPRLAETPSADPAQRTEWNVRDSDRTVICLDGRGIAVSPGTALTRDRAVALRRPHLVVDIDAVDVEERLMAWLADRDSSLTLNVAGPRESEAPGIQAKTRSTLEAVLGRLIRA